MALTADTFDVDYDSNGGMIADSWTSFRCSSCDGYHIELLDRKNRPFASLSIEPEDFVPLARMLMEAAAVLAERGQLELPRVQ